MAHGISKDEKLDLHRDKFEVIPDMPKPSTAIVRRDDDSISVVPNMVVVTDGRGRIGILEWYDRD